MSTVAMWIGQFIIAAICIIFLCVVGYVAWIPSKEIEDSTTTMGSGEVGQESQKPAKDNPLSLELDAVHVFTEPSCLKLLCVIIGSVLHVMVTNKLKFLKFHTFFTIVGIPSGYIGVWLLKAFKGSTTTSKEWITVSLSTAFLSSWMVFASKSICVSLNSATVYLWLCISIPATLSGGYLAAKKANPIKLLVLINKIKRLVPRMEKYQPWFMFLLVGFIASFIGSNEIIDTLVSTSESRSYTEYSELLFIGLLLIACTLVASGILISMLLISDQSKLWWWRPFFATGGSFGLYLFLKSMTFSVLGLKCSDCVNSFAEHLVNSLISSLINMLVNGAIGFVLTFVQLPMIISTW